MLSLLFILSLAYTYAQEAVAGATEFRGFSTFQNQLENSVAVAGAKVTCTSTGQFSGDVALNAAAFKFVCGGVSKQLAFGAAAVSATASVDWKPVANGQGSLIYSIAAAFAEIVVGLSNLFVFKNRDGVAGFQYTLGANQFDCSQDNGLDCVVGGSGIDLPSELSYTALDISSQSCNLPSDQGYNPNCTIWTITSTGQLGSTDVFQLTLRLASQKLNWGGHTIGPDFGKVDFVIWYPWLIKLPLLTDKSNAFVAVSLYVGGRAGTAGVQGGSFQGKDALIFAADKDQAAVIAWDGNAQSDGVDGTIFVNGISGASISAYDCSSCDILSKFIIGGWQIGIALASLGGWTSQLVILSWPGAGVTKIVYDPTVGMASQSDYTTNSGGLFLMPSFLTMMACFVFYRFFSR